MTRLVRFHPLLLLLVILVTLPAYAGEIQTGPAKQVEPPDGPSIFVALRPKIGFHPQTARYAVVYEDTLANPDAWRAVFLDADGNRLTSPLFLLQGTGIGSPSLVNVLPFPFSDFFLGTFQFFGDDIFGSNVFVGDAVGVAFGSFADGLNNYTNSGGDKFVANNCGEHEFAGPSAVDTTQGKFFLSYGQSFHFFSASDGTCRTSRTDLMAAYHQNSRPFGFTLMDRS